MTSISSAQSDTFKIGGDIQINRLIADAPAEAQISWSSSSRGGWICRKHKAA
jgi:hypothetical protein